MTLLFLYHQPKRRERGERTKDRYARWWSMITCNGVVHAFDWNHTKIRRIPMLCECGSGKNVSVSNLTDVFPSFCIDVNWKTICSNRWLEVIIKNVFFSLQIDGARVLFLFFACKLNQSIKHYSFVYIWKKKALGWWWWWYSKNCSAYGVAYGP